MLKAPFLSYLLIRLGLSDDVVSGFQVMESQKDSMTVSLPVDWGVLESAFRSCEPLFQQTTFSFESISLPYRFFDGEGWAEVDLEFTPFKTAASLSISTVSVEAKTPKGILLQAPSYATKELFLG